MIKRADDIRFAVFTGLLAILLMLTIGSHAAAVVRGGCSAQATGSVSGSVDITTANEWRVKSTDIVNGRGNAPVEQRRVTVNVMTMGIALPIINTEGDPKTSGSAGPYAVADYSRFARVIAVSGASDSCSGSLKIVVDDVGVMQTALGIGGAVATLIGVLGMVAMATRPGGTAARLGGALSGLLAGLGIAAVLQEAEVVGPDNLLGLAIVLIALVIGAASAGTLRRTARR